MKNFSTHPLRITRIITAVSVFGLFTAFFLGMFSLTAVMKPLHFIQFVPSLFSFGFILVLVATVITGRSYCSFLCPLGVYQDLFTSLAGKPGRRPHKRQPRRITGYLVLGAAALTFAAGSLTVINLVDPYSLFGRIMTNGLKPALLLANNVAAALFERIHIYWFSHIRIHAISSSLFAVTVGSLGIITAMSLLRGRLYCNTVCPVGALLSLPARFSLFKITIDKDTCTSCRRCENICKAGCIDIDSRTVYNSRCVLCFDCLSRCPVNALSYSFSYSRSHSCVKAGPAVPQAERPPDGNEKNGFPPTRERKKPTPSSSRRDFLIGTGILAGSTAAGILLKKHLPSSSQFRLVEGTGAGDTSLRAGSLTPVERRKAARLLRATPPGSETARRYTARCIGCHECVSVCPTRVLKPAFLAAGLEGMMVPVMDYSVGFCEYECTRCSSVCPTGAISAITLPVKKRTQIGTVLLIEDDCVVFKNNEDCGACAEMCPTHAVTTEKREGLYYPVVDNAPCIGCGSCEHACPVAPKAIFVEPKHIHGTAEPPRQAGPLQTKSEEGGRDESRAGPSSEEKGPQDAGEKEFPF